MKFSSFAKFAVCTVSCLGASTECSRVLAAEVNSSAAQKEIDTNFRIAFELKTPRRFASRFKKSTRMLEVRVTPANAKEFESSNFYDTRFVHRMIVREEAGEVILGFQLKNENIGWLVTYQENPWRIVVDIWRTQPGTTKTLEEQWQWQGDNAGELQSKYELRQNMLPREITAPSALALESQSDVSAVAPIMPLPPPSRIGAPTAPYIRLETIVNLGTGRIEELQRRSGESVGTGEEYSRVNELASALYLSGLSEKAVSVYRRLATMSESKFRDNPENLWRAGESAFLTGRYDLAADYLRTLLAIYPENTLSGNARVRIADVDIITNRGSLEKAKQDSIAAIYADVALGEKNSVQSKITSTLRILGSKIDTKPESATLYQQNLSACLGKNIVPFEAQKECAYIKTRANIEKFDINSADGEVQDFKKFSSQDPRVATLDARVASRVRELLIECGQKKNWDTWIDFEHKARPKLLDFTRADAALMTTRANAWEAAGELKNAAKMYGLAFDMARDEKVKDEIAARAALVLIKNKNAKLAQKYLAFTEKRASRKREGLTANTTEALRTLAQAPYRNKTATRILASEIATTRFVERDLQALLGYAKIVRGTKDAEAIFEKIVAFPAKNPEEVQSVENALFQYSDDLNRAGKSKKSAEILASIANIQQGTRRAEAAYKAGMAYARAGQLEKAKNSWQLAASDVSDKRFSNLANERLDRIR